MVALDREGISTTIGDRNEQRLRRRNMLRSASGFTGGYVKSFIDFFIFQDGVEGRLNRPVLVRSNDAISIWSGRIRVSNSFWALSYNVVVPGSASDRLVSRSA